MSHCVVQFVQIPSSVSGAQQFLFKCSRHGVQRSVWVRRSMPAAETARALEIIARSQMPLACRAIREAIEA